MEVCVARVVRCPLRARPTHHEEDVVEVHEGRRGAAGEGGGGLAGWLRLPGEAALVSRGHGVRGARDTGAASLCLGGDPTNSKNPYDPHGPGGRRLAPSARRRSAGIRSSTGASMNPMGPGGGGDGRRRDAPFWALVRGPCPRATESPADTERGFWRCGRVPDIKPDDDRVLGGGGDGGITPQERGNDSSGVLLVCGWAARLTGEVGNLWCGVEEQEDEIPTACSGWDGAKGGGQGLCPGADVDEDDVAGDEVAGGERAGGPIPQAPAHGRQQPGGGMQGRGGVFRGGGGGGATEGRSYLPYGVNNKFCISI